MSINLGGNRAATSWRLTQTKELRERRRPGRVY
jgi:hypothetical protein